MYLPMWTVWYPASFSHEPTDDFACFSQGTNPPSGGKFALTPLLWG